jgi:hypothetical protein
MRHKKKCFVFLFSSLLSPFSFGFLRIGFATTVIVGSWPPAPSASAVFAYRSFTITKGEGKR